VQVRRGEPEDAAGVVALMGTDTALVENRWGVVRVSTHVEHSCLSVTVLEEDTDRIVGFASFFDYPRVIPSDKVHPSEWGTWVSERFGDLKDVPTSSLLWLSLFVADPAVESEVADAVLRTMFTTLPQMNQCLLALPSTIRVFSPLADVFIDLPPMYELPYQVFSCPRENFIPSLKIRIAQVEDHDDLIPVLNAQSDLSTSAHGEFFLADIIEGQDETHKCIVAEADGKAVGLIAVTMEIDLNVLSSCHHLEAYGGLVRQVECEAPEPEFDDYSEEPESAAYVMELDAADEVEADPNTEVGVSASAERRDSKVSATEANSGQMSKAGETERRASKVSLVSPVGAEQTGGAEGADDAQMAEHHPTTTYMADVPNAFAITMFCLDKKYECRAADFLAPLFHVFGEDGGDYCVLTLPHTECESPLMPHFTHVQPIVSSTFPHSLYVLHRDALLQPPMVRYATAGDKESIQDLVAGMGDENSATKQNIHEATAKIGTEGNKQIMCVACCGDQVVGVIGLGSKAPVDNLKGRFLVEDVVNLAEHPTHTHSAVLDFFALHPTLECHSRHVVQEVMRITGRSLFTCTVKPDDTPSQVIHHFVQVQPRRQIQREKQWFDKEGNVFYKPQECSPDYSSLHVFMRRSLFEPKTVINARVLVVGASDTGLAFLESLLVVPYLHFNNLTLLARGGVQPTDISLKANSHAYAPEELLQLGLNHKVRIVDDTMIGLDRAHKFVKLEGGGKLPYDYLVIAVGMQDQTHRKLMDPNAEIQGVYGIGDFNSVTEVLRVAPEAITRGKLLVYGADLEAFSCIQGLLDHGIPASSIVFVLPVSDESSQSPEIYFTKYRLDQKVFGILEELQIEIINGDIVSFTGDEKSRLKSATFIDERGFEFIVECKILISCSDGDIDVDAFHAVNDQSLVYDGRLVVDGRFRTNDLCIFAAGPVVKHQRRLRAPMLVSCYNSREVGHRLAACILPVLDPASAFDLEEQLALAPYLKPKATGALIVGGIQFFVVETPTHYGVNPVGADGNLISEMQGRELVTDGTGNEYTRVTLNRYGCVCSLLHFGPSIVEHQNWICLYGLPETVINRLTSRYDEGIITDMVTFLREDWAMSLYHDRFVDFVKSIAVTMADDESVLAVKERVQAKLESGDFKVDLELRKLVEASGHRQMWSKCEASLKHYIGQNQDHLPMYSIATGSSSAR